MGKEEIKRYPQIDFIRVIGTLLVILAHVNLPSLVTEIRSFDVVALVFISGMSSYYSINNNDNYYVYIKKRAKKLIIPTYVVITIIFIISYIYCIIYRQEIQLFSIEMMLKSYIFYGGIGYIWIVKIYLYIAFLFPLMKKIIKKINNDIIFFLINAITFILYLILEKYLGNNKFLYEYFFEVFPYIQIALIGMRVAQKKNLIKYLFIFGIVATVASIIYYDGFNPSLYKFPPQAYYIAYGITVVSAFLLFIPNKKCKIIYWISKNSFTIYIWHIFILFVTNALAETSIFKFMNIWYFQYIIIIFGSMMGAFIEERLKLIMGGQNANKILVNTSSRIV